MNYYAPLTVLQSTNTANNSKNMKYALLVFFCFLAIFINKFKDFFNNEL